MHSCFFCDAEYPTVKMISFFFFAGRQDTYTVNILVENIARCGTGLACVESVEAKLWTTTRLWKSQVMKQSGGRDPGHIPLALTTLIPVVRPSFLPMSRGLMIFLDRLA